MAKSFEEIKIGDHACFDVQINEKTHQDFAKLSGDFSPVHSDDNFCANSQFGQRIGYAFLLTSFLSRLYGEYLPGGSSICIKQEVKFIKPYFIGDNITINAEVVGKIDSTKMVEIKTEMFRNNQECVLKGTGLVQVIFDIK